ncbi:MAG: hypothetical protein IKG96_04540 [Bacteroidaceae bacterium]|nr:hypothetical protein [Bacteroidaceae bacterium]
MKKSLLLMLLTAFTAVASFAQPAKRPIQLNEIRKAQPAKSVKAKKAVAPRKAPLTVADIVGDYYGFMQSYNFNEVDKVTLKAGDGDNKLIMSGLYDFLDFEVSLVQVDDGTGEPMYGLQVELGQLLYSGCIMGVYDKNNEYITSGEYLLATIGTDGSLSFSSEDYIMALLTDEEYAGYFEDYLFPGIVLDRIVPGVNDDVVFTPWDDYTLTYGKLNGDYIGMTGYLFDGPMVTSYRNPSYVEVKATTTDLVNVDDPNDRLLLSVDYNLYDNYPIQVGEEQFEYFEYLGHGNQPFGTLKGQTLEYIYIDAYGYPAHIDGVKDVLAGKILVCNNGGRLTYAKANDAMANGAVGIIIVNDEDGRIFDMNLSGYSYNRPIVGVRKAIGTLLKDNATYVTEGTQPYYRGTLTVSTEEVIYNSSIEYTIDYKELLHSVYATVYDLTNATPGATYQATISYEAAYWEYDPENDGYSPHILETTPTTLTLKVPEDDIQITFTPWADSELTYGSTEAECVGDKATLLSGLRENTVDYANIFMTNTNLVNVEDPDDQLLLAYQYAPGEYNLTKYSPLMVDGQEIEYTETSGYGNESIQTLAGQTLEYIYIDNYGTEEDFAKVKDVLAGKIAVCNRGSISFYVKANAAMANGAAGIIVVNNQEGIVNMSLDGYEYTKPAIAVKQEAGTLLKSNAEYVTDGEVPYYRGTLAMVDIVTKQTISSINYGYNAGTGGFYGEHFNANFIVLDWTNATPGATYQATITYPEGTYYQFSPEIQDYVINTFETNGTTTLTVTIPRGVPDLTFTPLADLELTYGSTEGDVAGTKYSLLSGMPELEEDEYEYAALYITNTNLVNVADPNDQLVMALRTGYYEPTDNLKYYSPLMVDGQEIEYTETTGYGNEEIKTLAGQTLEYIYIDNYGTEEDFAKVKDVLAGKIAVCNRGSISFYVKANAAMANGAAGIIIVNNQEGIVNMSLSDYEYTKPAIFVKQEAGTLLKSNAEYITDGEAPYYVGTLEMGEVVAGHNETSLGIGKDYNSGRFADYEIKAWVPDWTNATPGATYKATITYSSCTYNIWNADISDYDVYPVEIGTPSTTVTVTIPGGENAIDDVTADRNANGPTYNLMGIRVGKEYKGIVIKNGKKILR